MDKQIFNDIYEEVIEIRSDVNDSIEDDDYLNSINNNINDILLVLNDLRQ